MTPFPQPDAVFQLERWAAGRTSRREPDVGARRHVALTALGSPRLQAGPNHSGSVTLNQTLPWSDQVAPVERSRRNAAQPVGGSADSVGSARSWLRSSVENNRALCNSPRPDATHPLPAPTECSSVSRRFTWSRSGLIFRQSFAAKCSVRFPVPGLVWKRQPKRTVRAHF